MKCQARTPPARSGRGCSRRSSKTLDPRDSDSDSVSEDGEVHDLDEPEKAKRSEEDQGTKLNILMCQCHLMITTFLTGHVWPTAHKREMREEMKSAGRLDNVNPNMELNTALVDKVHKVGI